MRQSPNQAQLPITTSSSLLSPLPFSDQYPDSINNPFFYMLIVSMVFNSCFVFWWDMVMDWGMFEKNSGEYKFLREELVYSSPVSAGVDCVGGDDSWLTIASVLIIALL